MDNSCCLLLLVYMIVAVTSSGINNEISAEETDKTQIDGPVIIPKKSQIVLENNQNFTITCKSKRPVKIIQQELPEEITSTYKIQHRDIFSTDNTYKYVVALDLFNVDQNAVGYFACHDETIESSKLLTDLYKEPNNTNHVTYIYVYVSGLKFLFAPVRELIFARSGSKVIIGCRPTSPDINVTLNTEFAVYDPKIGFVVDFGGLSGELTTFYNCDFQRRNLSTLKEIMIQQHQAPDSPTPSISKAAKYFLEGETFSLNCSVDMIAGSAILLSWNFNDTAINNNTIIETNEHNITNDLYYKSLTVRNAGNKDAGTYVCLSSTHYDYKTANFKKLFLNSPFIELKVNDVLRYVTLREHQNGHLKAKLECYPAVKLKAFKDGKEISADINTKDINSVVLTLRNVSVSDIGTYTIVATNDYNMSKSVSFNVNVQAKPKIIFPTSTLQMRINTNSSVSCLAEGYPLPDIKLSFTKKNGQKLEYEPTLTTNETIYSVKSEFNISPRDMGNISCIATNNISTSPTVKTRELIVYEISNGFGIENDNENWYPEWSAVRKNCIASIELYKSVGWTYEGYEEFEELKVEHSNSSLSLFATLVISNVTLDQAGDYICYAENKDGSNDTQIINLTIAENRNPQINLDVTDEGEVLPYQPVYLACIIDSVPPPNIIWYKGGKDVVVDDKLEIINIPLNMTAMNSTIYIKQMQDEYSGIYECGVLLDNLFISKRREISMKEYTEIQYWIIGIGVVFILAIAYLSYKVRREKRKRKKLSKLGLNYFNEGQIDSLNPNLMLDEQAELLPYDDRFEFPYDKLKLDIQLGSGAFGVVYKAFASGIIDAEKTTTVAAKMVRKSAEDMHIKALVSELKIMVHLGKHVNIVNLLGACTKHVDQRELIVLVEYCRYGNIHNYMQKHREVFIDKITNSKDNRFGNVNVAFSYSGNSCCQSEYFASNQTQSTDHTFLTTDNTERSSGNKNLEPVEEKEKVSDNDYLEPINWRTNYEGDYVTDARNPQSFTSDDLLCWAFQVARGMEYLSSRKVLHADLAARNILLADDNVVKICDFGLARSLYGNEEYKKEGNGLLPLKWLAIESITDKIFSTQSDVWSFGIVLWEMFSLAKTPYPNVDLERLHKFLSEGHRLEKPAYADDKLYEVMLKCWLHKPTQRPTFTQLQKLLGTYLDEKLRNHYVDLNRVCADDNITREGQLDYLALMCAPDYKTLVSPNPDHRYVNQMSSFNPLTPTELKPDDDGYLPMSPAKIFSPRAQNTKFDFDDRKLNSGTSDDNTNAELTPMIELSSLPKRNESESDQEATALDDSTSLKIEQNIENNFCNARYLNNEKNLYNMAVSNPTYITLNVDIEKKPIEYMNIKTTHNGLII